MIPKTQFKRAVERFEKAVRRHGRNMGTWFEYREAKRELLNLGNVLITGEIKLTKVERDSFHRTMKVEVESKRYGAPKTGGI